MNDSLQLVNDSENFECAQQATAELMKKVLDFPELYHLKNARIRIIFAKNKIQGGGKDNVVLGKASKFSDKDAMLHRWQFLIVLSKEFWNDGPEKREALLFHELLHCGIDEDDKTFIVPHDLEEFGSVVQRYGLWKSDVSKFKAQMDLFDHFNEQEAAS